MATLFRKKLSKKEKLIITVCMLLLGVLMAMQGRAIYISKAEEKKQELEELKSYKEKIQELGEEIQDIRSDIQTLEDKYSIYLKDLEENEPLLYSRIKTLNDEIKRVKIFASLLTVEGSGLEIRIDDGDYMIVHDNYLYELVNELRAYGALAISINEKRLVSMTEFLCIGPSIRVNDEGLFPPFVIKVIGNPQTLERRLKDSSIYRKIVASNLRIDIKRKDNIIITKYSDSYISKIKSLNEVE